MTAYSFTEQLGRKTAPRRWRRWPSGQASVALILPISGNIILKLESARHWRRPIEQESSLAANYFFKQSLHPGMGKTIACRMTRMQSRQCKSSNHLQARLNIFALTTLTVLCFTAHPADTGGQTKMP